MRRVSCCVRSAPRYRWGFLALFVGSLLVSALQLHWMPAAQRHEVGIGVLAFTVPLQVIACLYGFLCRDVVASTGLGLLAATWAVLGVAIVARGTLGVLRALPRCGLDRFAVLGE